MYFSTIIDPSSAQHSFNRGLRGEERFGKCHKLYVFNERYLCAETSHYIYFIHISIYIISLNLH